MECLKAPFRLTGLDDRYKEAKEKNQLPMELIGTDGFARYYAMDCFSEGKVRLIVTYSEERAKEIVEDIRFFDHNVMYYPSKDVLFYSADIHGHTILRQRMEVIRAIIEKNVSTVVVSIDALLNKIVPLCEIEKHIVTFNLGQTLDLNNMKKTLVALGYERNDWVDGV